MEKRFKTAKSLANGNTVILTTNLSPTGMKIRYAVNGIKESANFCDSQNI
jgi:hypothetical protein